MSTSHFFEDIRNRVGSVIDAYMHGVDPSTADEFAGLIRILKENSVESISNLTLKRQANLFDEAVARVVLQKAANTTHDSAEQTALVRLARAMLYAPSIPNPAGTLNVESLIDEASAKLMSLRTGFVDWIHESGEINEATKRDLHAYDNISCFIGVLFTTLIKSPDLNHTDAVKALSEFGFGLLSNIIHVDLENDLTRPIRISMYHALFIWLAETSELFLEQLRNFPDELEDWLDGLESFFDMLKVDPEELGLDYLRTITRVLCAFFDLE